MLTPTLGIAGAALVCLAQAAPAQQDSHTTPALDRRIDEFVRDEMRRQLIPGVAVAVVDKGRGPRGGMATRTSSTWWR